MKRNWLLLLTLLLAASLLTSIFYVIHSAERKPPEGFYFGVSYGLSTVSEAKLLIDRVKDYTNFFVVNNWDISTNETALNEICDYAAENGLSFIVFFDFISLGKHIPPLFHDEYPWHENWVLTAKDRWKDKFLGIYIYEEPGGKQIDTGLFDEFSNVHGAERYRMFENVTSYSEAAEVFVRELPQSYSYHFLQNSNISKFVSDYALYWFDYLADYDTVFAELGWNHSTPQQIGLNRGAATLQNKDWGTIITWKSIREESAAIKSDSEMFQDMMDSYEAGANYVIVFNFPQFPEGNPFGVLTDEHFIVMEQFWEHASRNQEEYGKATGQVAFVLPKDYGWGMRALNDKIWGLWPADELAPIIWENMNKLIDKYDLQLDIVYDDSRFNYEHYSEVFFWNATIN